MNQQSEDRFNRRRLRGSYITVVLSVALVLFTLGLQLLLMLYADKIIRKFKEDIGFTAFLVDDLSEDEAKSLEQAVRLKPYARSVEYISKDRAVEILTKDLGEDFLNYLDYNPLTASIEVKLQAAYANTDSLAHIKAELLRSSKIKEITYEELLIRNIQQVVKKASWVAMGFAVLLLIVAIALINNSIRLAIYSKRFLIRTMMLVGATQRFIRRPFVYRSIAQGIVSALIAIIPILVLLYYVHIKYPGILEYRDIELIAILFTSLLVMGILISWASTVLAVRKFIRMRSQNLY